MRFDRRDVIVTTYNPAIPKPVYTMDILHTPTGRCVTGADKSRPQLERRLLDELRALVEKE